MQHWIDEPEALRARLSAWQGQARVGLDTEFIRERTFYPQLALVQLSVPGEVLLVDPLAPGVAQALRPLLLDRGVEKIMHSASEDLQALARGCDALPAPSLQPAREYRGVVDPVVHAFACQKGAG